jgi:hypothetical protein
MKPIAYSLQFRGRATALRSDRLRFELAAPSSALITTVGPDGVRGVLEEAPGGEATFEAELSLGEDLTFADAGTIEFGRGNSLRFRNVSAGRLEASPDPNLRRGAVVLEVEEGSGQFAGADGLITSNFFVSDTGEVTDNHFGLIFVHEHRADEPLNRPKGANQ